LLLLYLTASFAAVMSATRHLCQRIWRQNGSNCRYFDYSFCVLDNVWKLVQFCIQ